MSKTRKIILGILGVLIIVVAAVVTRIWFTIEDLHYYSRQPITGEFFVPDRASVFIPQPYSSELCIDSIEDGAIALNQYKCGPNYPKIVYTFYPSACEQGFDKLNWQEFPEYFSVQYSATYVSVQEDGTKEVRPMAYDTNNFYRCSYFHLNPRYRELNEPIGFFQQQPTKQNFQELIDFLTTTHLNFSDWTSRQLLRSQMTESDSEVVLVNKVRESTCNDLVIDNEEPQCTEGGTHEYRYRLRKADGAIFFSRSE